MVGLRGAVDAVEGPTGTQTPVWTRVRGCVAEMVAETPYQGADGASPQAMRMVSSPHKKIALGVS